MLTLRLEVASEGASLRAAFMNQGHTATADAAFNFQPSFEDIAEIRWYLEDYLDNAADPAPSRALHAEARMKQLGCALFNAVFGASRALTEIWKAVVGRLLELRVEIAAADARVHAIPWELMCNPATGTPLSLQARAFTRIYTGDATSGRARERSGPLRVLLIISRPDLQWDVPFRSVAGPVVTTIMSHSGFVLDILRPPTFLELCNVLEKSSAAGFPYDIVHFDGHGVVNEPLPYEPADETPDARAYVIFEDPQNKDNAGWADGDSLGRLLANHGITVLLLNACRSDYSGTYASGADNRPITSTAFTSLAQEVIGAGVPCVVAMRYNVYVPTASLFMEAFYHALAHGSAVSHAVQAGRLALAADPLRYVSYPARPLQDWGLPVIYESVPTAPFRISPGPDGAAQSHRTTGLPHVAGFIGRDDAILMLDRGLEQHPVVLLRGPVGSGKTATSLEFCHWHALTSRQECLTVYSDLWNRRGLAALLSDLEAARGIDRTDPSLKSRKNAALATLRQQRCVWILDHVEQISDRTGAYRWTDDDRTALSAFMLSARAAGCRFVVVSTHSREDWLPRPYGRLRLAPLSMWDSVRLATTLINPRGRSVDMETWYPLIKHASGNPLTLKAVISEARRRGLQSQQEIRALSDSFFMEPEEHGPSNLCAELLALKRSFQVRMKQFNKEEQRYIAALHLFRGFLYEGAFHAVVDPDGAGPVLITHLLERLVENGLASSGGPHTCYIHPALPWFLTPLFRRYHGGSSARDLSGTAIGNFIDWMSMHGQRLALSYVTRDNPAVDKALDLEEANLTYALALARRSKLWDDATNVADGLRAVYYYQGRWAELSQLLALLAPDCVDNKSGYPLPNREAVWGFVTQYQIQLALNAGDDTRAQRIAQTRVQYFRSRSAPLMQLPPADLTEEQQMILGNLIASLNNYGDALRLQQDPACRQVFEEAFRLGERSIHKHLQGISAYDLSEAFLLGSQRDVDQAEAWVLRAKEILPHEDSVWAGRIALQLGTIEQHRFENADSANLRDQAETHLIMAGEHLHTALELLGDGPRAELLSAHERLGLLYARVGAHPYALEYFQSILRLTQEQLPRSTSALTHSRIAILLADMGQLSSAQVYAEAALEDVRSQGEVNEGTVIELQELIAKLMRQRTRRDSQQMSVQR